MFLGNSKKILNKLNEGYQNIEQNYFIMNQNIEKYLLSYQIINIRILQFQLQVGNNHFLNLCTKTLEMQWEINPQHY